MSRCYLCNSPIQGNGNRRWMHTSSHSWGTVGRRGNVRIGMGNTTSLRTLCDDCDAEQDKPEPQSLATTAGSLIGAVIAVLIAISFYHP